MKSAINLLELLEKPPCPQGTKNWGSVFLSVLAHEVRSTVFFRVNHLFLVLLNSGLCKRLQTLTRNRGNESWAKGPTHSTAQDSCCDMVKACTKGPDMLTKMIAVFVRQFP